MSAKDMFDKIPPLGLLQFVLTPRGNKKDFEEAVEYLKKEYEHNQEMPPLVKAMKMSRARRELKEFINTQDIIQHAIDFGMSYENLNSESIDDDWIMYFFNNARNVCGDDAKIIWGKILAEESQNNGSIPKQLVHILSVMSKDDAELFNMACRFIVERIIYSGYKKMLLIDFNDSTGLVEKFSMNSSSIFNLESLGLVKVSSRGTCIGAKGEQNILGLRYHGIELNIQTQTDQISTGNVVLTRAGELLADLIEVEPIDGFIEYLKRKYEGEHCIFM